MRHFAELLIVSICFSLVGCGEGAPDLGTPVNISGTVTLDDKPVANVDVAFMNTSAEIPAEFRSFTGTTDSQGRYSIEGVYHGTYSVTFGERDAAGADPDAEPDPDAPAEETGALAGYSAEKDETAKVSADATTFDFAITTSSSSPED